MRSLILPPTTVRHLRLLLILTLLVQGLMYLSYPLPATRHDDNQAAQAYLMRELLDGNLLIGNVRYNTGYAYIMAPLRALTRTLGQLDDRAFLLAQKLAFSAIPFLVYDILRRRFDERTAFIAALVALMDPFSWQWAHFQLPEWLIALMTLVALWLAQLAWSASERRRLLLLALAAALLGLMIIARLNFAPVVAVFGCSFLFWRHISWRWRVSLFALTGLISLGMLGAYLFLIQLPSTGGANLSCTSGTTLMSAAMLKGVPLRASNGPHSARYAELLTLQDKAGATIKPGQYSYWHTPGPWVGEAAQAQFFDQPAGVISEDIVITFPAALFTYLGPCPLNALLTDVALEAIAKAPAAYALASLRDILNMLILHPIDLAFPAQYLERPQDITFEGEGALGIYRAHSRHYNGQRVWQPGIALYSLVFPLLSLLKLLTPFAIAAACWKRDWLLMTCAALFMASLVAIAAFAVAEPRYLAMATPLGSLLLGWLLARAWQWARGQVRRRQAPPNSP